VHPSDRRIHVRARPEYSGRLLLPSLRRRLDWDAERRRRRRNGCWRARREPRARRDDRLERVHRRKRFQRHEWRRSGHRKLRFQRNIFGLNIERCRGHNGQLGERQPRAERHSRGQRNRPRGRHRQHIWCCFRQRGGRRRVECSASLVFERLHLRDADVRRSLGRRAGGSLERPHLDARASSRAR
jgi:hypothetical protein